MFLSVPAAAQDAGLDCFDNNYSQEQRDQLAGLSPEPGSGVAGVQALVGQVVQVIQPTFGVCVESEGWTPEQTQFASTYEIGRLSSAVIRDSGILTEEELARFDAAIADPANADAVAATMNLVRASMGGDTNPDADDAAAMESFVMNNGFAIGAAGTDTAEIVGLLLSFVAVQRIGEEEFGAM